MKKIKVAMLAPYLYTRTGVMEHIKKLVKHLSRREDVELHLISIGDKNRQFKRDNVNVHEIKKTLPYPFSIPRLVWSLRHKTIEINPDIVHAEGSFFLYSTAAALLRNRYPTLLTVLGVILKEIKFQKGIGLIFYTLLHKPNERYVMSKIPNIIIITPSIKNLISKWTKSKIYSVQDGIEFEKIQGFQPHKSEKPDVLFLSHLTKLKGVDILIKALPIVLNSVPDLSVYIAGTGPQEEELKSLVKELNLEAHIKFLGFIADEEEKYSYYKACKVVVAPSRWDCQPYAVTEGAACGKPIIASDMSNPALLDDGKAGFVFQSENVVDLASKIIKLLTDDKLREDMGKAALEKAKECDWNKIADRHVEIYKEVIADFHERKDKGQK
jgi:glycosyltransferase involved in cell wall biosynthesis